MSANAPQRGIERRQQERTRWMQRMLAELLRGGLLRPVYHGENGLGTLRELARSWFDYQQRPGAGDESTYGGGLSPGHSLLGYAGLCPTPSSSMAEQDCATQACAAEQSCSISNWTDCWLRATHPARGTLTESRKHQSVKIFRQIPLIGPLRAALLLALMQTPHRFRSKWQLWIYSGLWVETYRQRTASLWDGQPATFQKAITDPRSESKSTTYLFVMTAQVRP